MRTNLGLWSFIKTMRVVALVLAFGTAVFAQDKKVSYRLPWEEGKSHICTQGNNGGLSHNGSERYAFDFDMAEGTKVCAAREGKVLAIKEDLEGGGLKPEYRGKANYVYIDHGDGTVGRYVHLKKDGALVQVGDHVHQGDVIGLSGATGYVTGPHLHFVVYKGGESVPIKFDDVETDGGVPQDNKSYVSRNTPGIPAAVKDQLLKLEREAKTAWDLEAFGIAYERYKKLSETRLKVKYPPVEAAKAKLTEVDKKCESLLLAIDADLLAKKLPEAVEKLLLAKASFRGTPCARKVEQALHELKQEDGYDAAAKALEKKAKAQDFLYRALENEFDGLLKTAIRTYQDCAKLLPQSGYAKFAQSRIPALEQRLKEMAQPKR